MNISFNWLKNVIDTELSPELLAEQLTRVGLAVEAVHPHGDDHVLDIDLTSNRPDCLSHLGVARELRAITGKPLSAIVSNTFPNPPTPVTDSNIVTIEAPELCSRFTARIIRNVKIGPSPEWLVQRLEAIGERSINNVADITNYVMHEIGQPMHAFDLDKLAANRIVVRRARPGETIKTLDDVERKLDDSMLAICDAEKPAAVAGVMGGLHSGITENTANVLIEVAYFDRDNIRQTSRKLGLATEASYRFERGVDVERLVRASARAAELIAELAGGEPGEFIDVYPEKFVPPQIESKDISNAVQRLTGLKVEIGECARILNALGIKPGDRPQVFVAPSWRHDIAIEEDLVEEIARHAGYENIKDELPPAYGAGEYQSSEERKKALRRSLVNTGFDEALSYSFIDTAHDGTYELVPGLIDSGLAEPFVTLRQSVIEGAVRMRPTLLPGLLESVRANFNHQRRDLKLFELGKAFAAAGGEQGLPNERELFAGVLTGGEIAEDREMPVRELDFYDAKGMVESALEAVGITKAKFTADAVKHLRNGQSASISVNGRKVGSVGRLSDSIAEGYKFRQAVYVAEIDLDGILAEATTVIPYQPLPKYPGIVRDVSLIVKRDVTFAQVRETVESLGFELCRGVGFVDIFEGKGMSANERSLTIRLEYRSDQRTLVDEEVDAVHQQILDGLASTLDAKPRF